MSGKDDKCHVLRQKSRFHDYPFTESLGITRVCAIVIVLNKKDYIIIRVTIRINIFYAAVLLF